MSDSIPEAGFPILRDTGCRVNGHVWRWTGIVAAEYPPDLDMRCLCGLVTWREAHLEEQP